MEHFIDETDHVYPQWHVVSPDETAPTSVVRERSFNVPHSPFRFVSWLCNHCSDYLAPHSPVRFGSCVMLGSKREAIQHVKAEYVRSFAALPDFTLIFTGTTSITPWWTWTYSCTRCLAVVWASCNCQALICSTIGLGQLIIERVNELEYSHVM